MHMFFVRLYVHVCVLICVLGCMCIYLGMCMHAFVCGMYVCMYVHVCTVATCFMHEFILLFNMYVAK